MIKIIKKVFGVIVAAKSNIIISFENDTFTAVKFDDTNHTHTYI